MEDSPKISIVIPSYNKVKFIAATLDSIVNQSYPDKEVIIQDGGSTDGTAKIIKQYAQKYPELIKWESKKDKGQLDAINKGLKKAKGEILTFINADDVYESEAFQAVVTAYRNHPHSLWFAGRGKIIDEKGKEISKCVTAYKNLLLFLNRFSGLLLVNYLMQPSIFLNSNAYNKYGPFTGTERIVLEYDLWLKLAQVQMPTIIDKTLSDFRLYSAGLSIQSYQQILTAEAKLILNYTHDENIIKLHRWHNLARIKLAGLY